VQELRAVLANIERFAHDVRPKLARPASGARAASRGAGAKMSSKKTATRRRR
jgi:hypothetical protein